MIDKMKLFWALGVLREIDLDFLSQSYDKIVKVAKQGNCKIELSLNQVEKVYKVIHRLEKEEPEISFIYKLEDD